MFSKSNETGYFASSPIRLVGNNMTNQKTLSIPIRKSRYCSNSDMYSKSWSGCNFIAEKNKKKEKHSFSPSDFSQFEISKPDKIQNDSNDFRPYNAINNCKSAGITPYALHKGTVYFLFQKTNNPVRRKDSGWNDFGGKRNGKTETTIETAAREFSEETSCLFYLKEKNDPESRNAYQLLKHNDALFYDEETIILLRNLIPISQKHYIDKITEFVVPIYASSKEIYITYFVKVDYIPAEELPQAEDIHIDYEDRYMRTCQWFSYEEVLKLGEKEFHKRLQITRIQDRIKDYYNKGLFI